VLRPPRFRSNLSTADQERLSTDTLSQTNCASFIPPSLYVFNASSLSKPHTTELLNAELLGCGVDVAVISETHLKKKHTNSCVNISGYTLFRRDRLCRKGGGVALYVRHSYTASEWSPVHALEPKYELLLVKVMKDANTAFIGALYHPPVPASVLLDHIESAILKN